MLCVLAVIVFSLAVSTCNAGNGPTVDCAFSVWSAWAPHSNGQLESRTRDIIRRAQNGGQPCIGDRAEYRVAGAQPPTGPEEFLGNLLAGNTPSYSLGGGRRYSLSRDIVLVLDNTVDPVIFPHYKSFISNIVGKICGKIGVRPEDSRLNVARFDYSAAQLHSFNDDQNIKVIQDRILQIPRSSHSTSNLYVGTDYARAQLTNENWGTRRYNNATKEVLFVTSERKNCSCAFLDSAERLKTTAEVYVIVLGRRTSQMSCLETLASYPEESHFLRLEGITEISENSRILLAQSPVNNLCLSTTSSSGNY